VWLGLVAKVGTRAPDNCKIGQICDYFSHIGRQYLLTTWNLAWCTTVLHVKYGRDWEKGVYTGAPKFENLKNKLGFTSVFRQAWATAYRDPAEIWGGRVRHVVRVFVQAIPPVTRRSCNEHATVELVSWPRHLRRTKCIDEKQDNRLSSESRTNFRKHYLYLGDTRM